MLNGKRTLSRRDAAASGRCSRIDRNCCRTHTKQMRQKWWRVYLRQWSGRIACGRDRNKMRQNEAIDRMVGQKWLNKKAEPRWRNTTGGSIESEPTSKEEAVETRTDKWIGRPKLTEREKMDEEIEKRIRISGKWLADIGSRGVNSEPDLRLGRNMKGKTQSNEKEKESAIWRNKMNLNVTDLIKRAICYQSNVFVRCDRNEKKGGENWSWNWPWWICRCVTNQTQVDRNCV